MKTSTNTRTITVTKRSGKTKSIESPYSDAEALASLTNLVTPYRSAFGNSSGHYLARDGFACDLAAKGAKYTLSEKQLAWVHILVCRAAGISYS